jgi:CIC family chloride channel protein
MKHRSIFHPEPIQFLRFALLSILVGLVAGLGAAVFRGLIALFHNLFFLQQLSLFYDANVHTSASPWGPWVILVPVAGALGVAFLVKNFAPEAKGHGVPEVLDAIYYQKGVIRPIVAVIKSVASALSIGSGGSIGREGPIIQIGSSFGSTLGQILKMPAWQRITLIAGGAGAGIAATFNTPVGGVLFALEIMMHEVSARTLVPVAICTATGTYVGELFFGPHPSFVIPALEHPYFHLASPWALLAYVLLGVITGVVSAIFIRAIYAFEDFFEQRVKGSYYRQHVTGMLLVGVLMYVLQKAFGHYYVEGVGYATIQDILAGTQSLPGLLVLLFALKLFATSLTLGSGASGGIFSPALYMGATVGAAYGVLLGSPPAFAVAAMAGLVAGSTGAAMAAIVMIFEMTLDYSVIVPMTIAVAVSYGVRKSLSRESIYTLKLVRRGHFMPEALQTNVHFIKPVKEMMDSNLVTVPASGRIAELARLVEPQHDAPAILVRDEQQLVGVLTHHAALGAMRRYAPTTSLAEVRLEPYVVVPSDATFFDAVEAIRSQTASVLLVAGDRAGNGVEHVAGWISKERLIDAVADVTELFSDSR